MPQQTMSDTMDVVLIGAGIMSATLGTVLKEIEPTLKIVIFETLHDCAQSHPLYRLGGVCLVPVTRGHDPDGRGGGGGLLLFQVEEGVIIFAELLQQLPARLQLVKQVSRPRLCVGLGVLNRKLDLQVFRVHATEALDQVQGRAVWMADAVQPSLLVEAG